MIEFDGVTRRYGAKVAVDQLELRVERGELFAFLGPNGAGKTTTIKMLVGLLRPTRGAVRVCGFDVVRAGREARLRMGYVPDEPQLYDKLTGREFLRFIVDMYGLRGATGRACIDREIAHFELDEFVDELTENYSHGMKQRLVFASAMLHEPEVLVIDEPMVGLDPRSARLVKDLLRSRADAGVTIFMSTHTLALAEEVADRIGIVHQGRLRCLGTFAQLQQEAARGDTSLEQIFLAVTSNEDVPPRDETADRPASTSAPSP